MRHTTLPTRTPFTPVCLSVCWGLSVYLNDPQNELNRVGRKRDGTGGDILWWKRKAEEYLIASGLTYTICHPGSLVDSPGGRRDLVWGVNDDLLRQRRAEGGGERVTVSVSRPDLAEVGCGRATRAKWVVFSRVYAFGAFNQVLVQSLICDAAKNRNFDLGSRDEGQGTPTNDFDGFFRYTQTHNTTQHTPCVCICDLCLGVCVVLFIRSHSSDTDYSADPVDEARAPPGYYPEQTAVAA